MDVDLGILTLAEVASRCKEQSQIFVAHKISDERFCLEIFRRAIVSGEDKAWDILLEIYTPKLKNLIAARHSGPHVTSQLVAELTQNAFTRFWHSFRPKNFSSTGQLGPIIVYLNKCAISEVQDWRRKQNKEVYTDDDDAFEISPDQTEKNLLEPIIDEEQKAQLWSIIKAHCNDKKDLIICHCMYVLDFKPSAIVQSYPHLFAEVHDVYARWQSLKDRLRRSSKLEGFLKDEWGES